MRRYRYKVEFLPIEEEEGEKKIDKEKIEETLNSMLRTDGDCNRQLYAAIWG